MKWLKWRHEWSLRCLGAVGITVEVIHSKVCGKKEIKVNGQAQFTTRRRRFEWTWIDKATQSEIKLLCDDDLHVLTASPAHGIAKPAASTECLADLSLVEWTDDSSWTEESSCPDDDLDVCTVVKHEGDSWTAIGKTEAFDGFGSETTGSTCDDVDDLESVADTVKSDADLSLSSGSLFSE